MRSFPSAARQHAVALLVGVLSVAALTLPLAHADEDDLTERRKAVEGRISETTSDLAEASREAVRATQAQARAEGRLTAVRTRLAAIETRLTTARERETQLQEELVAARVELVEADLALAEGQQDVVDQRLDVRDSILELYAYGDPQLRAIGAFFDNATLEDLQRQDVADKVIVGRGAQQLDAYEVAEEQLTVQQAKVESARDVIADKTAEAKRQVAVIARLLESAQTTESRVAGLVSAARDARRVAVQVKAADQEKLDALREREDAIAARLAELARIEQARAARQGTGFTGDAGGFLAYPTDGPVTSPFGYRTHPIYGYYALHNGTDFGVACGSPLYASAGGTVLSVSSDAGYGNRVFVNLGVVNGNNLVIIYNHLSGFNVSEGQRVERGDVVGFTGSTGLSTGCHLHFTVMENGVAVDPMKYL